MDLSSVRIRRERKTVGRFLVENACFWHKADMLNALTNVRFLGQSGHGPTDAYQPRFMITRPSSRLL
jgi:hypothetical protein